jgi:hypothetical protein
VAIADLNNDGLLDIVINNNNAAPAIYLNRLTGSGNWLRVELAAGPKCNRDGIGARVQLQLVMNGKLRTLTRWVEAGTGYAAQSDMRPHFGLSNAERVAVMRVTWPDGTSDAFRNDELSGRINSTIRIEQGRGIHSATDGIAVTLAN